GIVLQDSVILFPSPYGNLHITDGGDLETIPNNPQLNPTPALIMSDHYVSDIDSLTRRWLDTDTFGLRDHGPVPLQLDKAFLDMLAALPDEERERLTALVAEPATISMDGSMKNLILMTSKQTRITVEGDMRGCSFSGQN